MATHFNRVYWYVSLLTFSVTSSCIISFQITSNHIVSYHLEEQLHLSTPFCSMQLVPWAPRPSGCANA